MKLSQALKGLLIALVVFTGINVPIYAKATAKQKVVYIQDGSIDELVVPILLNSMENVDHLVTVMVNGDCYADVALKAQSKINNFVGSLVPSEISTAKAVNPFPDDFRLDANAVNELSILNKQECSVALSEFSSGDELLKQTFNNAADKSLIVLLDCGATPLSNLLKEHPEYTKKVKELIWMGGAIDIKGNVVLKGKTTTAEWNMYWDPSSAEWLFKHASFPIILFPLNVTDQVKLFWDLHTGKAYKPGQKFLNTLRKNGGKYNYSKLAYDMYNIAVTKNEKFYSLWDTTSACYIFHPEYFVIKKMKLKVSSTKNPTNVGDNTLLGKKVRDEGTTYRDRHGREVSVVVGIKNNDPSLIFNYIEKQLKRNSKKPEEL